MEKDRSFCLRDRPFRTEHRGFHFEDILRGFDQKDIYTTTNQRRCLLVVDRFEVGRTDRSEVRIGARWEHPGGTHAPRDESRSTWSRIVVGSFPREFGRCDVYVEYTLAFSVLVELEACATERIRFNDVGAGFEVAAMNLVDDAWFGDDEPVVRTFKLGSTKISGG